LVLLQARQLTDQGEGAMKKVLVGLLMSCVGLSASAQSSFSGFSAFGNLNHITSSTKLDDSPASFDGLGKSSMGFTFGADYGLSLSKDNVLLVGATYNVGSPKFLNFDDGTDTIILKEKSAWSVYVAPGTEVVKDVLVYAKLSYHNLTVKASGTLIAGDQDFKGFGYGVGSRINLNKTTYMTVEFQQVNYDKERAVGVDWKPTATVGSVGFGFKF
jgi:hypothetical protein